MLRKVLLTGIFGLAMAANAAAQAPASSDQCLAQVKSTFSMLAAKKLTGDAAKQAEDLLNKMAGQCTAQDFAAAGKTATALQALTGG